jgi:ATP-dependent DNA helicase RecG
VTTLRPPVQVNVFSDRIEVSNPGELPRGLTPEQLRLAHPSIPHNPLISEVLFLYGYIEKAGTGTTEMIRKCREAGLPEPHFRQVGVPAASMQFLTLRTVESSVFKQLHRP